MVYGSKQHPLVVCTGTTLIQTNLERHTAHIKHGPNCLKACVQLQIMKNVIKLPFISIYENKSEGHVNNILNSRCF